MAFSTTKFPVQAWKLTPSFKPAEVTVTSEQYGGYATNLHWRVEASDLFRTKEKAIASGKKRLDEQQAKLDKSQARLDKSKAAIAKKRAELTKAEAKP